MFEEIIRCVHYGKLRKIELRKSPSFAVLTVNIVLFIHLDIFSTNVHK